MNTYAEVVILLLILIQPRPQGSGCKFMLITSQSQLSTFLKSMLLVEIRLKIDSDLLNFGLNSVLKIGHLINPQVLVLSLEYQLNSPLPYGNVPFGEHMFLPYMCTLFRASVTYSDSCLNFQQQEEQSSQIFLRFFFFFFKGGIYHYKLPSKFCVCCFL